jgi:hypothetical protein
MRLPAYITQSAGLDAVERQLGALKGAGAFVWAADPWGVFGVQRVAADQGAAVGFPEADRSERVPGRVQDLKFDGAGAQQVALCQRPVDAVGQDGLVKPFGGACLRVAGIDERGVPFVGGDLGADALQGGDGPDVVGVVVAAQDRRDGAGRDPGVGEQLRQLIGVRQRPGVNDDRSRPADHDQHAAGERA